MTGIIKVYLYVFLAVFVLTALLCLGGFVRLWFFSPGEDLPYLRWLAGTLIVELVGIVFAFAKRAFRYFPTTISNKTPEETAAFMADFISKGTSVTIVSNRAGWLVSSPDLLKVIESTCGRGTQMTIILRSEFPEQLRDRLKALGVRLIVTGDQMSPEARFTLINAHRSGAERLAIARGTHPAHQITIFDNDSGPEIIGLAKDIICKSAG